MNIALIGYGKMGRAIERIATERGHNIVLRISTANRADMTAENLSKADIAIEFTNPESAAGNVMQCLHAGIGVVCGSTGWNDRLPEAEALALNQQVPFLHATNFSIGVNLFFEVNKLLATLMNGRPEYTASVEEAHHVHKKDMPGGTAITLAEQIIGRLDNLQGWLLHNNTTPGMLPVTAHRTDELPGTHKIAYTSAIDTIEITHTAHNRDGFATGSIMAAEFIHGKKGVFTMKDVLGINDL